MLPYNMKTQKTRHLSDSELRPLLEATMRLLEVGYPLLTGRSSSSNLLPKLGISRLYIHTF